MIKISLNLCRFFFVYNLFFYHTVISTGPPVIIEHPLDTLVINNDPVTLPCRVQDENSNITWYKNDEPVKMGANIHRILLNSGSLFLLKVITTGKEADTGTYYCIARNEYGETRSQDATVRVASLKDDFKTRPRNVNVVIGSRAIMECAAPKGFPEPEIYWKKENKEIKPQEDSRITIHPHGNLIIENVQKNDAGNYQCVALNAAGTRESNQAKLSVHAKPTFIVPPRDRTAEIGSSVFFDCQASGDPMPSITFKKNGEAMPVGRAYIHPNNKGLTIQDVQMSDAGEYICIAENSAGRVETTASLKVHSQPKFIKKPLDVEIKAGETAYFECKTSGMPKPDVFWSKESQQDVTIFQGKTSSDGRMKVTNDGDLLITDIRLDDEGNYICAAVNSAGSSKAEALLKVISKATILAFSCTYNPHLRDCQNKTLSGHPPPLIKYGHMNQTLLVAGNALLPCQASGSPPLVISWLKDGNIIELQNTKDPKYDERYRQLSSGSLQIFNLMKSDTGVYTCRAKNNNGESTWTAYLVVEEHSNPNVHFQRMPDASTLPSPPGKPMASNTTDTSVQLDWSVPEKAGANMVSGYILQYYSPEIGETWFNIPDYIPSNSFKVKNLKPNCTYVFVVRAENTNGIGPPSEISSVVYTKTSKNNATLLSTTQLSLELARQRLGSEQLIKLEEVRVLNSTAIQLTWKRRKDEPLIQGYYIKWRGPPLTPQQTFINVTSSLVESAVVNGLKPFTTYEFFMIPYHRTVQGMPSNSMDGTTKESVPTSSPTDVRVRMLNMTTLRISWRAPPTEGLNGILKGFYILITGDEYTRNITTNERAGSVTLYYLTPGKEYKIRVAARTAEGIGIFHGTERVVMNEETLQNHIMLANANKSSGLLSYLSKPWVVAVIGFTLWLFITLFLACVWYRWKKTSNGKTNAHIGMPFIKINDGSVHFSGHDGLWMDHGNYTTQFNPNGTIEQSVNEHYHDPFTQTLQRCIPNSNYPIDSFVGMTNNSITRSTSPHQYSYAAFPGSSSTYNKKKYGDDPSPYATTTLIMSGSNDRSPQIPLAPVPQEPPPNFCMLDMSKHNTARRYNHNNIGSINSINRFKRNPSRDRPSNDDNNGRNDEKFDTGNYVQVARDYDSSDNRSGKGVYYNKTNSASSLASSKNHKSSRSHSRTMNQNITRQKHKISNDQIENCDGNQFFLYNNTSHDINKSEFQRNNSHTPKVNRRYNDVRNRNGREISTDDESAQSSLLNNHDQSFGSDEDYNSGSLSGGDKNKTINDQNHSNNINSNRLAQSCMGVGSSSLYHASDGNHARRTAASRLISFPSNIIFVIFSLSINEFNKMKPKRMQRRRHKSTLKSHDSGVSSVGSGDTHSEENSQQYDYTTYQEKKKKNSKKYRKNNSIKNVSENNCFKIPIKWISLRKSPDTADVLWIFCLLIMLFFKFTYPITNTPRLDYITASYTLPPSSEIIKRNMLPPTVDTIGASGKNRFGRPYISGRPLLNCDRKRIVDLFEAGVKKIDIARALGVTHSCISKVIRKYLDTGSYTGKETRTASCACPGGSDYHDVNICRNAKFRFDGCFQTIGISISQKIPGMKRASDTSYDSLIPKKKRIFTMEYILSNECGKSN
uniref:Roundabout homolog 1-like n=1 Tax=Parastrongyloides trichosuri TaxID=131310 RepID=A0A0N4Z9L2_PARTI